VTEVHATAAAGFHAAADVYARARPGYPEAAIDLLVDVLPDGLIADVAAGTGKLTASLVARGLRVIGSEPVEGMRRSFQAAVPSVPMVGSTAERLPFATGALAGATVAQGFHWFDSHAAVASLGRCIRPGGVLAVVWNVRDQREPWVKALTDIIDPYETGGMHVPRYRDSAWRAGFIDDAPFREIAVHDIENLQDTDEAGLRERVASVSFIAVLAPEERERVLDDVSRLTREHPDLAGRERFTFPYVTEVHLFERI
jgi:SAM-dependent methyltransferase